MFQWLSYLFVLYNRLSRQQQQQQQQQQQPEIIHKTNHTWLWNTHFIYYEHHRQEKQKQKDQTPSLVLIHGFGASTFHWRDNIPALSKEFDTYAFDLLGFGTSDKPTDIKYTPDVWQRQTVDFVKKVYHETDSRPVVLVGNSIGGYTAVYAAAHPEIRDMVSAVILLNPVGVFRGKESPFASSWLSWIAQPTIFRWLFHYFQSEIKTTLTTLYPHHPERVDETLVASILTPSYDPRAKDVFSNVLQTQLTYKHPYMEDILRQVKIPLYLIIGKDDPWLIPNIYTDFLENCPTAFGKKVNAGHCPHDEIPDEVNWLIISFLTLSL